MFYDPLSPRQAVDDGCCELPDTDGDHGNQNGGNGSNEPSIPDTDPPTTLPEEDGNTVPADAIDPKLLALAMAFVPYQSWETPYATDVALSRGTIFPSLDKPFLGEPSVSDSPSLRWGG